MEALTMMEVELLESEIRRLKLENKKLLEENQRLKSTVSDHDHKKVQSDIGAELESLKSKKEKLETNFSKILLEVSLRQQELKDELDQTVRDRARLQADLNLKSEEADQLLLEVQELEKTNQEDLIEHRKAVAERDHLMEQKDAWEKGLDNIIEDNTLTILALLATQNGLEEQLDRKAEIMEAFSARVLELVRDTRRIVEDGGQSTAGFSTWENGGGGCPGWVDGENGGGWSDSDDVGDSEMENVMKAMAWPVEEELKAIERAALGGLIRTASGARTMELGPNCTVKLIDRWEDYE